MKTFDEWMKEQEKLCERATVGPWHKNPQALSIRSGPGILDMVCAIPEGVNHDVDGDFIAASRLSLPKALKLIREIIACNPGAGIAIVMIAEQIINEAEKGGAT